ncbi:unnamed protein product, partial [Staurois parvus]
MHTQKRVTHTHTHTHTDTCIHIQTCTYVHTRHMYVHTHMYMHTQPTPPIKSCSTSLFTHRSRYCTLGGGREHSTHSLLCFHCVQLLSSLTARSANDRSGLSSEPAQQTALWDTHTFTPHHNFHSPLASRQVEIPSPGL